MGRLPLTREKWVGNRVEWLRHYHRLLESAFSLENCLVLISSSAIADRDVINKGLRPEKRQTADSFVVNKPAVSPETE